MAGIMQIIIQYGKPNPTRIKISNFHLLRVKYFILEELNISSGIFEEYFYISIGRIAPRLGGSRDGYGSCSLNSTRPCNS